MRIVVRVYPGAPATKVGGRYGDSEPPVLIVRVAAHAVVSGLRARTKVVEVESVNPDVVAALLRQEQEGELREVSHLAVGLPPDIHRRLSAPVLANVLQLTPLAAIRDLLKPLIVADQDVTGRLTSRSSSP
jgi:hypothetical protein